MTVPQPNRAHRSEDVEPQPAVLDSSPETESSAALTKTSGSSTQGQGKPNPTRTTPATPSRRRTRRLRVPAGIHTFDSFRYRNYRIIWANTVFSSGGFWLQQIVIGWLTYELTQSAFLTTLAMGLDLLPILFIGPLGGLLVDSWAPRKLMAVVYAYQGSLTVAFGMLVITERAGALHIFGYVLLMGLGWVILDPSRISLISNTVPKESLMNAFALMALGISVARLVGPAIGGAIIALTGPGPVLFVEAGLQFAALFSTLAIKMPTVDRPPLRLRATLDRLLEGALYIRSQPIIWSLILLSVVPPLILFPFLSGLMPVFAAEVYHTGPVGLGILMSSMGAGAVLGSLALASMGDMQRKGRLIIASTLLTGLSMFVFSQIPSFIWAIPVIILSSVGMMAFFAASSAVVQSVVADEFRGRVSSIHVLTFGLMPLGSLAAGALAQRFDAPMATMLASGAVMLVVALFLMRPRTVWRFE